MVAAKRGDQRHSGESVKIKEGEVQYTTTRLAAKIVDAVGQTS
jgi:hypothetical protein